MTAPSGRHILWSRGSLDQEVQWDDGTVRIAHPVLVAQATTRGAAARGGSGAVGG